MIQLGDKIGLGEEFTGPKLFPPETYPAWGRYHKRMHVFFQALPKLATKKNSLQFGQLGHLFPGVKTRFCAYGRKKVPLIIRMVVMIIVIVMMVILMIMMTKKHTNIISFE